MTDDNHFAKSAWEGRRAGLHHINELMGDFNVSGVLDDENGIRMIGDATA